MPRNPESPAGVVEPGLQAELPAPDLVRRIYRGFRRFLSFLASRIDLQHFPGSCCG
jgi:hypothetical protein